MLIVNNNKFGLVLWGTKRGKQVFAASNLEEKLSIIDNQIPDIRNYVLIYNPGKTFYSIENQQNRIVFSYYRTIEDWVGRMGFYAVSIIAEKNIFCEKEIIPELLKQLSELYYQNYVAVNDKPNRISEYLHEDISLFENLIDKSFESGIPLKIPVLSNGKNIYVTYNDDNELKKIFSDLGENNVLENKLTIIVEKDFNGFSINVNEDKIIVYKKTVYPEPEPIFFGKLILKTFNELPIEDKSVTIKTINKNGILASYNIKTDSFGRIALKALNSNEKFYLESEEIIFYDTDKKYSSKDFNFDKVLKVYAQPKNKAVEKGKEKKGEKGKKENSIGKFVSNLSKPVKIGALVIFALAVAFAILMVLKKSGPRIDFEQLENEISSAKNFKDIKYYSDSVKKLLKEFPGNEKLLKFENTLNTRNDSLIKCKKDSLDINLINILQSPEFNYNECIKLENKWKIISNDSIPINFVTYKKLCEIVKFTKDILDDKPCKVDQIILNMNNLISYREKIYLSDTQSKLLNKYKRVLDNAQAVKKNDSDKCDKQSILEYVHKQNHSLAVQNEITNILNEISPD